jgi:nitrite reductase/ring-hydroxylating ferredoxin subunit
LYNLLKSLCSELSLLGVIILYLLYNHPLLLAILVLIYEFQVHYLQISSFTLKSSTLSLLKGIVASVVVFFLLEFSQLRSNPIQLFLLLSAALLFYLYHLIERRPLVLTKHFSVDQQLEARKIVQLSHYPCHYPNGYYCVTLNPPALSISPASVHSITALGEEYVFFRTNSGNSKALAMLDAYCPHLGANLSVGGKVVDDSLVCPFHGWSFNSAGKCVNIPYLHSTENCDSDRANSTASSTKKIPEVAKTESYALTQPHNTGLVIYHYEIDRAAVETAFSLPSEYENLRFVGVNSVDIAGNIAQIMQKFINYYDPTEIKQEKANFHYTYRGKLNFPCSNYTAEAEIIGPSMIFTQFHTKFGPIRAVFTFTPHTAYFVRCRAIFYAEKAPSPLKSAWIKLFVWGIGIEIGRIMGNLDYSVDYNGPHQQKERFLAWYQQFYSVKGTKSRSGLDW